MATQSVTPPVEATPAMKPDTPAPKLAGKFDTPEDLEKAYVELQAKLGAPAEVVAEETPAEETPAEETPAEETPAESPYDPDTSDVMVRAGLNPAEIGEYFTANESLSDEHYAALETAGYPRALVDKHIKTLNQQNQEVASAAESAVGEIIESVGGQDAYKVVAKWAGDNLSDDDLTAYNEAVQSGNKSTAGLAVRGLKAQYEAANGRAPQLVQGGSRPSADVYNSRYEMQEAMKNAKYGKDSAYTMMVQEKALRSNVFDASSK